MLNFVCQKKVILCRLRLVQLKRESQFTVSIQKCLQRYPTKDGTLWVEESKPIYSSVYSKRRHGKTE